MRAQYHPTIVRSSDQRKSALLLTRILGLPDPSHLGSMLVVESNNTQHDAFLVSEEEFDQVFTHIRAHGLQSWSSLGRQHAGRGLYFGMPDGPFIEIMTQPYAQACVTETSS